MPSQASLQTESQRPVQQHRCGRRAMVLGAPADTLQRHQCRHRRRRRWAVFRIRLASAPTATRRCSSTTASSARTCCPIGQPENKDTTNQFKIEGQWSQDKLKAKFGFQYVDDTKDLKSYDDFQNNDWQAYAGYGPASDNTGRRGAAAELLHQFVHHLEFHQGLRQQRQLAAGNPGVQPVYDLELSAKPGESADHQYPGCKRELLHAALRWHLQDGPQHSSVQTVEEKTYAPYLVIQDETPIGSMKLHESFGVRFDETTLYSSGLGR